MAFTTTLTVDPVGQVTLAGVGPWHVHEHSRHSFDIRDSEGRTTNPTVVSQARGGRGMKSNANVVYASKSIPNAIVVAFNAELAKNAG